MDDEIRAQKEGTVTTYFKNVKLILENEIVERDLCVRNGRVINAQSNFYNRGSLQLSRNQNHNNNENLFQEDKQIVDCKGLYLAPGFIDIQINGSIGVDFSSPEDCADSQKLEDVSRFVLHHGVTAFCPTVITSSPEVYREVIPSLKINEAAKKGCAEMIGVHVEGPFISNSKFGAHPSSLIQLPRKGIKSMKEVYGEENLEKIKLITLAPEIKGALKCIKDLSKKYEDEKKNGTFNEQSRTIVSIGHSAANLSEAEDSIKAGATCVTHMFNAMKAFHHRDPGIIGLLAKEKNPPFYGIIADGIHCDPTSIRLAHKANKEGLILVTDGISATGLQPGAYNLGRSSVEITKDSNGTMTAHVTGTDILSGSVATLDSCLKNFKRYCNCSIPEAVAALTSHPAKLLGIQNERGTLNAGSLADLVLLDEDLNVLGTWLRGKAVWMKKGVVEIEGLTKSSFTPPSKLVFKRYAEPLISFVSSMQDLSYRVINEREEKLKLKRKVTEEDISKRIPKKKRREVEEKPYKSIITFRL